MGLRILEIHQYLDCRGWICAANHDEYVLDHAVVSLRYYVLDLGKEIQDVDEKQQGAPYVIGKGMKGVKGME